MANEGLAWDPLLKMVHNPGGDSNPGRGDNPTNMFTPIDRVIEYLYLRVSKNINF